MSNCGCACQSKHRCCQSLVNCCNPCGKVHTVTITGDRFVPFQLTIETGDSVQWINANEEDQHTVVANPTNLIGPKPFDKVVPADNGTIKQRFCTSGLWNYHCKYHATLDKFHQPIAPGPGSDLPATPHGVQGFGDVLVSPMNNSTTFQCPDGCAVSEGALCCNFGTPMMGMICVLPRKCC